MSKNEITAVGIDVSKGKSTVAVRRPGGEIVMMPFVVLHTAEDLAELTNTLRSIGGEIRVVMEHTGMYWRPIALALKEAGFFVSVVNAIIFMWSMFRLWRSRSSGPRGAKTNHWWEPSRKRLCR